MPRIRFAVLLLLGLLIAPLGGAHAAPIPFGFSLQFTFGPLAGQSFAGTLSVDGADCAGSCNGTFIPNETDRTLLSFDVTVGGTPFAISDDDGYAGFPRVAFSNGVVTGVDFLSSSPSYLKIDFVAPGDGARNIVEFSSSEETQSTGTFVPGQGLPVPEPGTLALLSLGLAGLAATRRREQ